MTRRPWFDNCLLLAAGIMPAVLMTGCQPAHFTAFATYPEATHHPMTARPLVYPYVSVERKQDAVLSVARGQLGTPYVLGESKDNGQPGFDASHFTAYVYRHALGYEISKVGVQQYQTVGSAVPVSEMRPGDLLIFDNGAHVGIYAGKGRMIQAGGGLGKVGYLPIEQGTFWGQRISAVKRLF